ncbi:MAG: KH domain-containing protein, partial [Trueperaceae bacterium]|nr:KH domain-containing protein [Trueperaceae bacterium]
PVYLIGNKVDAAKYPDEALDLYKALYEPSRTYVLSALDDPNSVYALRDDLLTLAPESPYFFPDNIRSDQRREDWAAELIRESAMIHLRQEIPYAVAVQVLEWEDPADAKEPIYISAEIWVEKTGHRMIVIGKGGKMIREIGKTARKQLEVFLNHQIYLDLEVVVHKDWRQDLEALRELGYEN